MKITHRPLRYWNAALCAVLLLVAGALAGAVPQVPAPQDNDHAAWQAFGNEYWPALYVVDRTGRVRYTHVGELHQGTAAWDRLLETLQALRAGTEKRG